MNIPKSVIDKDCTPTSGCGRGPPLNHVETEAFKRLKTGNWDPRNEIPSELESSTATGKIVASYPYLERLEIIRKTIMKELDKMDIAIVDTKDSKGRKKIEMKFLKIQPTTSTGHVSEPAVFDNIMKAVLAKHMGKHGKHIMELGY